MGSLMCLDFYKDIESYVQHYKFENEQSEEITEHIDMLEEILSRHGLDLIDIDTDKIENLIT